MSNWPYSAKVEGLHPLQPVLVPDMMSLNALAKPGEYIFHNM